MTTEAFGTAAHARLSQLAQPSLDGRIALGLPVLLLQFAQRYLVLLEPLPVLEQAIGGDDREDRHHGAEHVHGERARERQDQRFAVQACVQDLPSAVLRRARLCVESDVTAS